MKIVKEKFKTDHNNKLYWGRVYFISDNREWKTKILWAMSFEWVRRQLQTERWSDREVDKLVNKTVVSRQKNEKRKIFKFPVKLLVCGVDAKDETNLTLYLQERDRIDRHG